MSSSSVTLGLYSHRENYFLCDFGTQMTLARKGDIEHVLMTPETLQQSITWKTDDLKAMYIIVKCLSPTYRRRCEITVCV